MDDDDEMSAWDASDADEFDALDELDEMDDQDAKRKRKSGGVRVYTLIPKRQFDYSFLGLSPSFTNVTIRRALKLPQMYYYWVALRIHNKDITSGNFALQLFQTLPSAQDPQEFSLGTPSITLSCLAGDTAPTIKTTTANNLGPYFKVVLVATQLTASARLYAELSAVLYARPA
jgi:hypothetical protein